MVNDPFIAIGQDVERIYVAVDSANAMRFSVTYTRENFEPTMDAICQALPAMARVDAELAELYDGTPNRKPAESDLARLRLMAQVCYGRFDWEGVSILEEMGIDEG